MTAWLPDFVLSGGTVLENAAVAVRDGVVESVGGTPAGAQRLAGKAILPGLVSAHSHAFQRAIRGRTERRAPGRDDFWSWREAMYAVAERLTPDELYAVSRYCFLEMARAGITAVGEFHYLHRAPDGRPYANPNELDEAVLRAARDVGLRTVLLRVAYARAGFDRPENPRQRRFIERSADEFLRNLDALAKTAAADPLAAVGAAPHSVRACPAEWIRDIAAEAKRRRWPLHLHVSEQPAELEQCRAEHGTTPPLLLQRLSALDERTTAVHGVHLDEADIEALGAARATVCACPTTERNLGDGIVRADRLIAAGASIALGTDSNVQIAPLEDARALESHLRLADLERNVLDPGDGRLGERLYAMASEGGMRSLGLPGGGLRVGEPADFVVVDLEDASLAGATRETLAATAVFALERTAIRAVYVAGRALDLSDGAALPSFLNAMKRIHA